MPTSSRLGVSSVWFYTGARCPGATEEDAMTTAVLDKRVNDFVATTQRLLIGGRFVDAASGRTFETPNPATGETLASVAEGDAEDIDRAVRAARAAFDEGPWGSITPSDRGRIIWRIGDLILEHAEELAQLESLDNGKPYAVALG